MAKNYVQDGNVLTVTAPAAVTAGNIVLVGANLFGVALGDAANGAQVEIQTDGVFTVSKTSALAISAGDIVYYHSGTGNVDKTATGGVSVGIATAAAANPSATVSIMLEAGL